MRLDINLASQPYEDARQFWTRWGSALGVVGLVTLLLLTLTINGWLAARRDRSTLANLRNGIAERDAMRAQAEEILNRPENRATRDDSQFLNRLIERKSLSWTRVFEDLEQVMPARVHVMSIQPELDEDNQLTLKMIVAGDSREKAIELARRMEESRRFAQTYVKAENFEPASSSWQFNIEAIYVPQSGTPVAGTPADTPESSSDRGGQQISKRSNP